MKNIKLDTASSELKLKHIWSFNKLITYILPDVQSEPLANAVQTGHCEELPPISKSVLTRG